MTRAFSFVAQPHILLVLEVVSSLPCVIDLLLLLAKLVDKVC